MISKDKARSVTFANSLFDHGRSEKVALPLPLHRDATIILQKKRTQCFCRMGHDHGAPIAAHFSQIWQCSTMIQMTTGDEQVIYNGEVLRYK